MGTTWQMPDPPWHQKAEEMVLGSILLRPQVLAEVMDIIGGPEDFYRQAHGRIYQTILDLHARGEAVDVITVAALLRDRGELEEIGGASFLSDLYKEVGTSAHARSYARFVADDAQIRRVQATAARILQEKPNGDLATYLHRAESQMWEAIKAGLHRVHSFLPLNGTETLVSELLRNEPPPREYLFKEFVPANMVGVMVSMGGIGKGYLT